MLAFFLNIYLLVILIISVIVVLFVCPGVHELRKRPRNRDGFVDQRDTHAQLANSHVRDDFCVFYCFAIIAFFLCICARTHASTDTNACSYGNGLEHKLMELERLRIDDCLVVCISN